MEIEKFTINFYLKYSLLQYNFPLADRIIHWAVNVSFRSTELELPVENLETRLCPHTWNMGGLEFLYDWILLFQKKTFWKGHAICISFTVTGSTVAFSIRSIIMHQGSRFMSMANLRDMKSWCGVIPEGVIYFDDMREGIRMRSHESVSLFK